MRIPRILRTILCDFSYHSPLHGLMSLNMARATFTNSLSSAFSSCVTCIIKLSITPIPSSPSSSLKTFYIFSPLIKVRCPLFHLRLSILNDFLCLIILYYCKRSVILVLLRLSFYLVGLCLYILVV